MSTSPSPSPGGDAAAGSSQRSSTTDGAGLLGDAGPAFEPGAELPPTPELPAGAVDALAGGQLWTEPRVKGLLTAQGALLHGAVAVDKRSTEWEYTSADLAAIAPALTRILNRYEPTRAAAAGGDELILAVGFAGYAARSISERKRALDELRVDEPDDALGLSTDHGLSDDQAADVTAARAEQAGVEPEFPADGALPPISSPRRA